MKKDFNNQIDNYNSSIDSKIDGAIASYLAGINLKKKTYADTLVAKFNQITMSGYVLQRAPQIQALEWSENMGFRVHENWGGYVSNGWNLCNAKQARSSNNDRRLIVDAGNYSTTQPTKVTWVGVSKNFDASIVVTRSQGESAEAYSGSGDWPGGGNKGFVIQDVCNWNAGLYTSATMATNCFNIFIYGTTYTTGQPDSIFLFKPTRKMDISYAATTKCIIPSGWTTAYDHDFWCLDGIKNNITVTDPKWIYSITKDEVHTLSEHSFSTSNAYMYCEGHSGNKIFTVASLGTSGWAFAGRWNGATGTNKTFQICDLVNKYSSNNIKSPLQIDGFTDLSLNDGIPLIYAKQDDEAEWTVQLVKVFKNYDEAYNGEFKIYFSYGPFKDGGMEPSEQYKIKLNGTEDNFVETVNQKAKIEFEMPETGYVFVKMKPVDNTITNWRADFDEESKKYISIG